MRSCPTCAVSSAGGLAQRDTSLIDHTCSHGSIVRGMRALGRTRRKEAAAEAATLDSAARTLMELYKGVTIIPAKTYSLTYVRHMIIHHADKVWSFEQGLSELVDALVQDLSRRVRGRHVLHMSWGERVSVRNN